jgi:flagellar hook-associated protein 2
MGTTSNAIFTGSSAYSSDFQNLISRATAIASLPVNLLNSDMTALTGQSSAMSTLDSKFEALQTAVSGIANALSGSAFQADISDKTKVGVSLFSGAAEGSYLVDVVDAGAYATSLTKSAWIAPSGATRTYRISISGSTYPITAKDNSAAAVAAAINTQFGDQVRATVVNVGGAIADYRISLQATRLGDSQPTLFAGPASPTSLQNQQTAGNDTRAASRTAQTWVDDPGLTFQLSLNGQTYALTPADNTAQGVANAINSAFGNQVTAAVVDVGDAENPNLRVTLTATAAGDLRPDLLADDGSNGPISLQQQTAAGSDTESVSQTAAAWSNDSGPTLTYELSIGGAKYALTPADNTYSSLIAAINTQQSDKIHAELVDLGGGGAHDYRIQLTAAKPGDLKPDLIVSQVNLQQQQTTGALARYVVNNSGNTVSSDTRSVTIATGVNVTLLAKDNSAPVTVTVTRPTSALSSALSTFTDAYNAVVDELDKHQGTAGGALVGQSLVSTLSRTLSGIGVSFANSSIGDFANLGLEVDKTGHLNFDPMTLAAVDLSNSGFVTSFFGSSTSGFVQMATDCLNSIEDPLTGTLTGAESLLQKQIATLTDTISEHQARVDDLTTRLQQQMAAADALIASMEQQYSYMSNMIAAMKTASEQYG